MPMRRDGPFANLVPRRLPGCHLPDPMRVLDRGVQPGGQRAEVRHDLGGVLETHLAWRRQPGYEHAGDRLEGVRTVGDELLEHRDGRRLAALEDDLGIATQPW